jgi:hypothetical protein
MLNIESNDAYRVTRTKGANVRITKVNKGQKPYGQIRLKPKGKKGKMVAAIVSTYVDAKVYKAVDRASQITGKSPAQLARQGLIREVSAILVTEELGIDQSVYALIERKPIGDKPTKIIKGLEKQIAKLEAELKETREQAGTINKLLSKVQKALN